ncbi:MAG TPA: protein kinase, partial [Gammaproteobacteria bacterium]|nr:protein kinase [Gammaproteobacteria bacterium]
MVLADKVHHAMEIPGYTILHEIGRGGMSTVYLAVQKFLERQVALKVMSQGLGDNPEFKKRFLKEGQIVARLNHRNIVTIYDTGIADELCFIAMEYVVGRNLGERIQGGLSVRQCISIVKHVARALSHAHNQGFIHRDIKPSNILLRNDTFAVLADFGIAKALQDDKGLTVTGLTPGTPNYMSPEQLRGHPLDGRSDLYCLGVVLYEMLTRERPFEAGASIATALRQLNEPPPELPDQLSFLQPVMDRLLAKEPADRFNNALELIKALGKIRTDRPIVAEQDADKTTVNTPQVTGFEPARTGLNEASRTTAEATSTRFEQAPAAPIESAEAASLGGKASWGARIRFLPRSMIVVITVVAVCLMAVSLVGVLVREFAPAPQKQLAYAQGSAKKERDRNAETLERANEVAKNPGNQPAPVDVEAIATRLEDRARKLLSSGEYKGALAKTNRVLKLFPQRDQAVALRSAITAAQKEHREKTRIATLLAKAKQQLANGNYIEPRGSSALDLYHAIQALDPASPKRKQKVKQGLQAIAAHFLAQGRQAQNERQADQALAAISQGLRAVPKHQGLLALRTTIHQQQQETSNRNRRLANLRATAAKQMSASRLITPKRDNAYETYQKILKLNPGDKRAASGIAEVANRIYERARAQYQSGALEHSMVLVRQGLDADPNHKGLTALEQQIQQGLQAEKKQRHIAELLKLGEQQLADRKLALPAGDNALETYQQVLSLDANNK